MSKKPRLTRRKNLGRIPETDTYGERFQAFVRNRLANPDPRSHAEFLADMRAKQAAGMLHNPATASLLDRLERAIAS